MNYGTRLYAGYGVPCECIVCTTVDETNCGTRPYASYNLYIILTAMLLIIYGIKLYAGYGVPCECIV